MYLWRRKKGFLNVTTSNADYKIPAPGTLKFGDGEIITYKCKNDSKLNIYISEQCDKLFTSVDYNRNCDWWGGWDGVGIGWV